MSLEFAQCLLDGKKTKKWLKVPISELRNHVILAGGSGSGKTHFARAMLEDILALKISTIVIDSQGDLLWLTRVKAGTSKVKKGLRGLKKRVFTPDYSDGYPFVIAPILYSPMTENSRPLIRYWIRSILRAIGYEIRPGQTSPEEYQLEKTAEAMLKRRPPPQLSLRTLLEEATNRSANWTIDKVAPILTEDVKVLISRLGALLGNESRLYDGDPFRVQDLAMSKKGGLWIIYLVPLPTETRQLILNWVCEAIYQWMMNTATSNSGRPRLVLFIDEALEYVTEANLPENRQALFRLLNQGRKYGVSVILAVQTPRGLPPEVSNNCKIKIFGSLDEPGDLDYVKYSTGLRRELDPLRDRSRGYNHAFVVRIPGKEATFCRARDLLTRKGRPLAPRSPGMTRILKSLGQFKSIQG